MRRTWVRRAAVSAGGTTTASLQSRIETARQALSANPDSRDRHRELFRWLSVAGELDEAANVAGRWIARDPLDADALMRQADVSAPALEDIRATIPGARAVAADLSKRDEVKRLAREAGSVDLLVNNAGLQSVSPTSPCLADT